MIFFRRYVPELKDFPLRYIYEPWKASTEIQTKANCIIGMYTNIYFILRLKANKDNWDLPFCSMTFYSLSLNCLSDNRAITRIILEQYAWCYLFNFITNWHDNLWRNNLPTSILNFLHGNVYYIVQHLMCSGKDYPKPIVEHSKVWKKNMKMMSEIRDKQKATVALTDGN